MKLLKNFLITTLTAATVLSASGALSNAMAGDVMVKNPWSRASAGMARAGGAFLEIHNMGAADDKLVEAKSDIAARTELHTHLMDGDVMKMRQVDHVPVVANSTQMLQPGSYHVMFMGLKAPLMKGTQFPLTLVFENAGEVSVMVEVLSAGAKGAMDGMGNMDHGNMKMGN